MEQIQLSPKEFIIYGALAGAALGFILGLLPLILGIVKGKARLGLIALLCSVVGGAIFILLSVIPVVIFTWMILKKPAAHDAADSGDTTGNNDQS
jgi:hypothetical protein